MYRNQKTHENFTLQLFQHDLLMANVVMYFRKNFFLKESIDRTLKKLSNAGLIQYWINQFVDRRYLYWKNARTEPFQTKLIHLRGAFTVGFIGLGLSSLVFVVEILWARAQKMFSSQNFH